jgi:integrase
MVPIPPGLAARIERYGRQTRRGSSSGALFLGDRRSSKTGEYEPLTASETAQLTRDLGQDALQRRVHPHLLRRSFASKQRHSRDGQ